MANEQLIAKITDLIRRYDPDPCDRMGEVRNSQVQSEVNRTLIEIVEIINEGGGGDTVTPFEITARIDDRTATAREIIYDPNTGTIALGAEFTVHDWTNRGGRGDFFCNLEPGHEGVAVLNPERGVGQWDIITLEGLARFVKVTFDSKSGGDYTFNVDGFFGAYPNGKDPGSTIVATDPLSLDEGMVNGDTAMLIYDDSACAYILLAHYKKNLPAVVDCLVRVYGTGLQNCDLIPAPSGCVYDGFTLQVNGDPPADWCNAITDKDAVKIIDARTCNAAGLKHNERYLACKLYDDETAGISYYAVVGETTAQNPSIVDVIEINDGAEEHCKWVDLEDQTHCVFKAKINTPSFNAETACEDANWNPQTNVWAIPINDCHCHERIEIGDRYLAKKLLDSWGPNTDKRPLYAFRMADPEQTEIVVVADDDDDTTQRGNVTPIENECVYRGKLIRVKNRTIEDNTCDPHEEHEMIWIVQANRHDATPDLPIGERYDGIYLGKHTIDDDERCVYAVFRRSQAHPRRWFKALTNWYKALTTATFVNYATHPFQDIRDAAGGNYVMECPWVIVQEVDWCTGNEIAVDPTDKNVVRKTINNETVEGYLVVLETCSSQDPNVEKDNILTFDTDKVYGMYSNQTSADRKIGDVIMSLKSVQATRQGWGLVNGSQNATGNGGTGYNMKTPCNNFPRYGTSPGDKGGKAQHTVEDLAHRHGWPPTEFVEVETVQSGLGDALAIPFGDDGCTTDPSRSFEQIDPVGGCDEPIPVFLPGQSGQNEPDRAPVEGNVCAHPSGGGEWGPLSNLPNYMEMLFYERLDNSQQ